MRFRPSTHFFRLLKVETEANKQKMFKFADENRQAKEKQYAADLKHFEELRDLKIQRNLQELNKCHEQELTSFDKKALARYNELCKLRQQELDKHSKAMNVKMSDLHADHRKEVAKCELKYKNYPATRPACDFNITASHCHERSVQDPEYNKITGCSNQTWRRNRTDDLNMSLNGHARQNNVSRHENVLECHDNQAHRLRYQPRPLISEFDHPFAKNEYRAAPERKDKVRKSYKPEYKPVLAKQADLYEQDVKPTVMLRSDSKVKSAAPVKAASDSKADTQPKDAATAQPKSAATAQPKSAATTQAKPDETKQPVKVVHADMSPLE